MASSPIELSVGPPAMNSTYAEFDVSATSKIVDGGYVFATLVGGSGSVGVGSLTTVQQIVYDPSAPETHLDTASGTMYISTDTGLLVLPDGSTSVPSVSDYEVIVIAHPTPVTTEEAQTQVKTGTYTVALSDSVTVTGESITTTLRTDNLVQGASYTFSIHGYDATEDYITTIITSGTTTVDPVFNSVTIDAKLTAANVAFDITDGDSATVLRSAVVPLSADTDAVEAQLVADTYTGAFYEATLSTGGNVVTAQMSNLTPATAYRVMAVAIDTVSSNVIYESNNLFTTYAAPTVLVTQTDRTYSTVTAQSTHTFQMNNVDVVTAIVPYTTPDINAFLASDADPLGNISTTNYPIFGTYSMTFTGTGLSPGVNYAAVSKVVPQIQPDEYRYNILTVGTAEPPSIVVGSLAVNFFDAMAPFVVIDPDNTVNVYAAIHADLPAVAVSNLLNLGSTAYPGSVVAVDTAAHSNVVSRYDLQPDTPYYVTVVAVETENNSLVTYSTRPFVTYPVPDLTLDLNAFTDTVLLADVTSTGQPHDLFIHVTPYLIGDTVAYDAAEIAATLVSTDTTHVILSGLSNVITASFSNLLEHTRYGIVAVVAQEGNHYVLNERSIAVKTAALPDLIVTIQDVSFQSVDFRVVGSDLDGPFRLLTAVTTSAFTQSDAAAFAAAGMTYTGSGVVDGTQTDFPNDVDQQYVSFDYSESTLSHDTNYVAVAVAVDEGSGVVQWAQQPFLTDYRPSVSVSSVVPSSFKVTFDAVLTDRDGPELTVRYNTYTVLPGLSAGFVAVDTNASQTVSSGTGTRTVSLELSGLDPDQTYHIGIVAISPDGTTSALTTHTFSTDPLPDVSLAIDEVMARSMKTTIEVAPNGVQYNAAVALFPYGTAIDDELALDVFANTACNMIARDVVLNQTGAISKVSAFSGLTPGDRIIALAIANRDDGDDDVVYASCNLYLRVEPQLIVSGSLALTSTTIDAAVLLAYNDPDVLRTNNADLLVTVLPSGDTDYSWFAPSATANPSLPVASVLTRASTDAVSETYAASNLVPATDYDLVVYAADSALEESFSTIIPFTTRAVVTITATIASVTASAATLQVTAALPDGTFHLYTDVFHDAVAGGSPDDAWFDVAITSGTSLDSGVSFTTKQHTFSSMTSQNDYIAVVVAVDDVSGEKFTAYASFKTSALPPSVNVVDGSTVATSSGATLSLLARDIDSDFTCFAKAFALSNADPVDAAVVAQTIAAPDFTRAFHSSVAQAPFTVTVNGLEQNTDYRLVAVVQDSVTLSNAYDFEDFTTLRQEDYLDRVEYDNNYTLTWRRTASYSMPVRGVQVANGKIAFRSRLDDVMGVEDVVLGGSFDFNAYGGYTNNLVHGFGCATVSLYDHSLGTYPASFTLSNQSLDMQTALLQNKGRLTHEEGVFEIEQDIVPLRQMPYCTLNMYRMTTASNFSAGDVRIFHEMTRGEGMDNVKFDSTTVFHPGLGISLPVFQAEASVRDSSHTIAAATIYLFDETTLTGVTHSGFNTFRNLDRAFDSHVFADLQPSATYAWATLTAQATSADFPRPKQELVRLLTQVLSLANGSDNLHDVAVRLRADHVSAWSKLWQTSATITPKSGLTVADSKEFYRVKRALRFAQFQLFSSVRDHGTAELNPLYLSSIDVDGNMFWNRELWIVPALLYFRPKSVRAMLEHRYESLRAAKTLASAQGHEGARFPYVSDIVTYGAAAPYWDVASASYVFNSALVGVATWDYFRASHDRDWLIAKGYPMLSAIADYVCSVATIDGGTGVVSFPDVLDVNGNRVTDPSFTLYACRLAIKGAIESTYELRYPLRESWIETYAGISVRFFTSAPTVVKYHSTSTTSEEFNILEPLYIMQPHYVTDFLKLDIPRQITTDHATLVANVAHYAGSISNAYLDNPFNTLLQTTLYAQVNRSTGTYSDTIKALVKKAIDDAERDVWGAMSADPSSSYNDVSLCAMLILVFVTGFAGMHINGGVAQSGFYYEPFGVRSHATSYLPNTWQNVVVTGGDGKTRNVINNELYTP